ncbi:MAG TPA: hypothetical protein VFH27_03175 [Longimicrobiaceae bacterium]|nr:hypothetical protein [Longimicrobiaceae bacterium]
MQPVPVMAVIVAGLAMWFGGLRNARGALHPGEPAPFYGGSQSIYGSSPLEIVGMNERRVIVGRPDTAAEMHVLVVMAGDSVVARESAQYDEEWGRLARHAWAVYGPAEGSGKGDRVYRLDYGYDRSRQTATVADNTFDIRQGNLFVVHLGKDAKPRIMQIHGTFQSTSATSPRALTDRFVAALDRDDPARRILDPDGTRPPCPPKDSRRHTGRSPRETQPGARLQPSYPST